MSDEQRKNLLSGTRDWSGGWGNTWEWKADGTNDGFDVMSRAEPWSGLYKLVKLTAGHTYTFSACVKVEPGENHTAEICISNGSTVNDTYLAFSELDSAHRGFSDVADGEWHIISHTFTTKASKYARPRVEQTGYYNLNVCAYMLVEGDQPAAWAPAEGETLAGGGALMSANLLAEGDRRNGADGTTYADGVWSIQANGTSKDKNAANDWPTGTEAVTENQTLHVGLSVRAASGASVVVAPGVAYVDGAGNVNYIATRVSARGTGAWQRVEGSFVMPSGMRVSFFFVHNGARGAALELTAPCLSYGSPVTLASSAHTPYATQDHLRSEYATKAALKVTSDAVTAEVEERGKLAGRVGTLESTSGTHTSRLEQLAASIKSLVKGESTYTDPDGKSATSGIYSLVTQTRDSVTALFGSYTKTADLASTQAVKDAKKAGTDAQAAASAAQTTADSAKSTAQAAASDAATAKTNASNAVSTANSASTSAANAVETANAASSTASSASSTANSAASTANAAKTSAASAVSTANSANSTAGAAKSTADSLATMIREDATGITVGKSADGKTYSTGRTRMTADAFEVLGKAGEVLSSFGKNLIELGKNSMDATISMLAGLVKIQARNDGSNTVASVSSDFLSLDSLWQAVMRAGKETGGAYVEGYAAAIADVTSRRGTARLYCTQGNGSRVTANNAFTVLPDGYDLSRPEYLAAALLGTGGGGGKGITHSQDAVTMASDLNACGPGVFSYNASTANRPTDYGTCVCIRAGDGTDAGTWLFQVALPTAGDPYWRRNINGAGWEGWWVIKSQ